MFYRRLFDFPTRGFRSSFRELDRLQRQMEQWHGALSGGALPMPSAGVFPLTNVTEDNDNYYVRAELPGIKSNELEIQVTAKGIRITSYNVCYTKLLRSTLFGGRSQAYGWTESERYRSWRTVNKGH